jgi:predicted nucleic acid-binding protein
VLAEVADALCAAPWREQVGTFIGFVQSQAQFTVREESDVLFARGLALYCSRKDKEWSLTDCISFVVMADEGLTEALTGDRHFEQAGFMALLAPRAS